MMEKIGKECIVKAAIQIDFSVFNEFPLVITGKNHSECLIKLKHKTHQGFLTSSGKFVDRKKALKIALNANQIINKHNPKNLLLSEDLKKDK